MKKIHWRAAAIAISVAASTPALAQDVTKGWRVRVTPYLWAAGYDHKLTDKATGETSEASADFGDILDSLKAAFAGQLDVQYNRVGVFGDVMYLKLSVDQTINRPILGPIQTETEATTTMASLAAYYRVVESDQLNVDLLAGLRYVKEEIDLDVQGAGPGLSRGASSSLTKPLVGVRATQRIGPRSSLSAHADYAGFSGSQEVWQVLGTYNFQWTPSISTSIGYRHREIDLDRDRLNLHVKLSGPFTALTYQF